MKTEVNKKLVNFKLPPGVIDRLAEVARETGWTKTRVVELALTEFLSRKEPLKP